MPFFQPILKVYRNSVLRCNDAVYTREKVFHTRHFIQAMVLVFFVGVFLPLCCYAQVVMPVTADTTTQEALDTTENADGETEATEEVINTSRYYSPKPVKPVDLRAVDKEKWDDATNGLDYSKDLPKAQKEIKRSNTSFDPSGWNAATQGIGQIFQILAIVLAILGIGYGIFRTMQAPRNRRIRQAQDGTIITADNVDAYIHETDLERFLREAIESGNYPLSIRLYYLQTIKSLSEKDAIKWSREKTNRDYLREMREHRLGREFREVTRTFERIWYGNEPLDKTGFEALEPGFKNLLSQV